MHCIACAFIICNKLQLLTIDLVFQSNDAEKNEIQTEESYVPPPPPGSPLLSYEQPRLKNPEKFIVNHLIYFHYNIQEHAMYVSPYSYPTHMLVTKPLTSHAQTPQVPQIQQPPPWALNANESPINSVAKCHTKKSSQFGNQVNKILHESQPIDTIPSKMDAVSSYPSSHFHSMLNSNIVTPPAQFMSPIPYMGPNLQPQPTVTPPMIPQSQNYRFSPYGPVNKIPFIPPNI